jgi:hypothetical protein
MFDFLIPRVYKSRVKSPPCTCMAQPRLEERILIRCLGKIKTITKIDWVSAFKNLALIEFPYLFIFSPEMLFSCRGGVYFVLLLLVVIGITSFIFPFMNVHGYFIFPPFDFFLFSQAVG